MTDIPAFDFGIICQSSNELTAVLVNLEERSNDKYSKPDHDTNHYTFGQIGTHQVVIAVLPVGQVSDMTLASAVNLMICSFGVQRVIYIGTAYSVGVPKLGDVVIATSLVECDIGHVRVIQPQWSQSGEFKNTEEVIALVQAIPGKLRNEMAREKFRRPKEGTFQVFTGRVGISSIEVRDTKLRDSWRDKYDLMAVDTLGMGIVETGVSCLIVQGICGYADMEDYTQWNAYAASTAAVVALKLLN
jgi:nucleoside phosphorylase